MNLSHSCAERWFKRFSVEELDMERKERQEFIIICGGKFKYIYFFLLTMGMFSPERQGELLIIGQALIWALFPVIAKISYGSLSPLYFAGISVLFGALFFILVSFLRGNFSEWRKTESYVPILISTLCIGVLYYGLFFIGLQYTSAGNAVIVLQAEIFFTILTLRLWNKEKLSKWQIAGSLLIVLGVLAIFLQQGFTPRKGDILLLIASLMPPIGNYYAKEARKYVSSTCILLFRNFFSGMIFLLAAVLFFPLPSSKMVTDSFLFLLINGFLLFGLTKLMWVEAIHRIFIGKAISLSAIGPAFTLLYAFLFLKEIPTSGQIAGLVCMTFGVYFLTRNHEEKEKFTQNHQ